MSSGIFGRTQNQPNQRNVAVQHARILQTRKDLEASILDSLIILSEYPADRSSSCSAASPSVSDVAALKKHVRLFQPSDYDDMVEERNVNKLCGYALCPDPKPKSRGGKWTFNHGQIVDREELERYCSDGCKKRALYVKIQLSETAAWERAGIPDIQIDLLDDDLSEMEKTADQFGRLKLEDQRQAARDASELALERGEKDALSAKMKKLRIALKENEGTAPQDGEQAFDDDHLRIEGYKTKHGGNTSIP